MEDILKAALRAGADVKLDNQEVKGKHLRAWQTPVFSVTRDGSEIILSEDEIKKAAEQLCAGPGVMIISNGAKSAGSAPDPLLVFLLKLQKHSLTGDFEAREIACLPNCTEEEKAFDGHTQYIGNFAGVSSVFNIWARNDSNIKLVIDALIDDNKATQACTDAA